MKAVIRFFKQETVFAVAAVLALGSMALVPPDALYAGYLDIHVLEMLFCLMLVVAGFQSQGVFAYLGGWLAGKMKDMRSLAAVLVFLCFFSSMLITNDVALLTFVPFAVSMLTMTKQEKWLIPVIVWQTIAANLGSMATPIGNPQNLYLYSLSGMGMAEFTRLMLPLTLAAFVLLLGCLMTVKRTPICVSQHLPDGQERQTGERTSETIPFTGDLRRCALYVVLFIVCMLVVAKILPHGLMLVIVAAGILLSERRLFAKADYALLGTFVCFFVFIGNMQRTPFVREFLEQVVSGRELLTAVGVSQIISNVPAAMLLSGFTDRYRELILGTNLGGLGTLIASLASLISYKCYGNVPGADKGRYLQVFTIWNLLFLAVMLAGWMVFC